jgi:predicted Zn-dependent peptidase
MNTLIGSAQAFSAGGPGKGMYSRAITNLMGRHYFVDGAAAINSHFSDSGLFGLNVQGPASHSADLLNVAVEELANLKQHIPDEELSRAKNILKMNILMAMERQEDRLEEIARNFQTYGDLNFHRYCDIIDSIDSDRINRAAARALSGKPTMVVTGGAINLVPNITDVQRQLE